MTFSRGNHRLQGVCLSPLSSARVKWHFMLNVRHPWHSVQRQTTKRSHSLDLVHVSFVSRSSNYDSVHLHTAERPRHLPY